MRIPGVRLFLIFLFVFFPMQLLAENMLMLRSPAGFEQTMLMLKKSIKEHGYEFAHVQRCDGGLNDMGYTTDAYRTVFFGKFQEVRKLTEQYPELIPFLPLKIAIIQEGDEAILFSVNPHELNRLFKIPVLSDQFRLWEKDLRSVFSVIRNYDELDISAMPLSKSQC